jgi:hypothetical protein
MIVRNSHTSPTVIRRGTLLFVAISSITIFMACASHQTAFTPLLNQGIMPVSEDNPYMGANLFLAKEMEQSVYLYNFMRDKGAPQGIELKGSSDDDVEAHFYYNSVPEEYVAKPAPRQKSRVRDTRREWIIIGPFAVERADYNSVKQLEKTSGGIFEIFGKREFLGIGPARGSGEQLKPVFIPTPVPTKRPAKHKPAAQKPSSEAEPVKGPLNLDQQALKEAKELAPRDSHGDVVHTVTSKTETFQSIAQWYTSQGGNAKEIAAKNALPLDAKLNLGSKIIIPKSIVTNPKQMK